MIIPLAVAYLLPGLIILALLTQYPANRNQRQHAKTKPGQQNPRNSQYHDKRSCVDWHRWLASLSAPKPHRHIIGPRH
jgi:hypothetical protein